MILDEGFSFEYLVKNLDFSRRLIEKNDVIVATATVIGVVKDGEVHPNRTPIKPNSEVFLADDEVLSSC